MTLLRTIIRNRSILIRLCEKSDSNRVRNFLRSNYYVHDQSSHSRTTGRQSREDEDLEMKCIDSGCTVLATTDDRQQEVIGVSTAGIIQEKDIRRDLQQLINLSTLRGYPNDLEPVIFVQEMKLRSRIYEKYQVNSACYLGIIAVRTDFQRFSLGNTLFDLNMKCAKYLGSTVAFGVSVTEQGIRIMESKNYTAIYTLKYVDYQDYRGLFIYNYLPPEACCKVFCKIL
ncbi:hypothetical protein DMENIID0001_021170 [Sergentomyia squamirostris]